MPDGDKAKTTTQTAEEVTKAHAVELKKRDDELAQVKKDLEAANEKIAKLAPPPKDEPLPAHIQKRLDDEKTARETVEKSLATEIEKRETAEFTAKAAALNITGIEKSKLGTMLRKISKALTADEYTEVERVLKAATEQAAEAKVLMTEMGHSGAEVTSDDQAALDKLVEAEQAKTPTLTKRAALAKVTESGQGRTLLAKIRKAERQASKETN